MEYWPDGPAGESARAAKSFAVRLDDQAQQPLSVSAQASRIVATLRPTGLQRRSVVDWLERLQIPVLINVDATGPDSIVEPLVRLPTLVVCSDSRLHDVAALYAASIDAPSVFAPTPNELHDAVAVSTCQTATVLVLNDRLSEPLCQAASAARRARPGLAYGFLTAFTPEHLAWLIVKTWAMFLRPIPETVAFADWSFTTAHARVRVRSVGSGATDQQRNDTPWNSSAVAVLGVRAHGAPYDLSMGETVLCGHLDALPTDRTQRAPSCFHDGVCFRVKSTPGVPNRQIRAVDALPLVWSLDSCASIPFNDNAFGEDTSYALGLIAGAAVGVIGPFLDVSTHGAMTQHGEALLATGGTLGDLVVAACGLEPARGFDKFLLIGSPDLGLLPLRRIEGQREGHRIRYAVRGEHQYAFRLAIPADMRGPVYVVGDDGSACWGTAECQLFERGTLRDVVVVLESPANVDGWLLLGSAAMTDEQLDEEAVHTLQNVRALSLYPFVASTLDDTTRRRCRRLARRLRAVVRQPRRLRRRVEAAALMANLAAALDDLHRLAALGFLQAVARQDVNLDRLAPERSELQPTARTSDQCPTCGGALYITRALWRRRTSYVRRWVQCANCSGLSLALEASPLDIQPPTAIRVRDELVVSLQVRNRSAGPVQVVVAALARRHSTADAAGPSALVLDPGQARSLLFTLTLAGMPASIISYRVLVLCRAGAELFALKHVLTPSDTDAIQIAHSRAAAGGMV